MTNNDVDTIVLAEAIATMAHLGQTDKLGADYISHPRRVSESVSEPVQKAIAWLHDVVEDTRVTEQMLLDLGIPASVVDGVVLMTRRSDVDSVDYYAAIRANPDALAVKLADIADNTLPWRTAQLDAGTRERLAAKYAKARVALGATDDPKSSE